MVTARDIKVEIDFDRKVEDMFIKALEIFKDDLLNAQRFAIPYDTGELFDGIEIDDVQPTILQASVRSTTLSDDGFDYPEFLNRASSHGHQDWWDDNIDDERGWEKALNQAAKETGLL